MRCKRRGEIAIFMALLLSVIQIFMLSVISNVRNYMTKSEIVMAMDNSLKSCFSEYNSYLYSRYRLMYIDPSYRTFDNNAEFTKDHFKRYMTENIPGAGTHNGFASVAVTNVEFNECTTVCSDNYEILYEDVNDYINSRYNNSTGRELIMYIDEMFGDANNPKAESVLCGEKEYIVFGCENDDLNISMAQEQYSDYALQESYLEYSYDDYLLDLISNENISTVMERMIEVMNMNICINGSPAFDLAECIFGLKVSVELVNEYGTEYTITRSYSYNDR